MYFSLRKDIFDYSDINYFFFFNNSSIFFLINVYSDEHQSVLNYLKNTEAYIRNVLAMARDFNIRDKNWDPWYPFHSFHSDSLMEITDSFELKLSSPIH